MLLLHSHTRRWMGLVCALWRRLSQRPRTGPEGVTAGQTGQTRLTIPRLDQTHRTSHPPSELILASHRGCHPIHTKELWKPRGWKITPSEQPSTISMFALVWSSTSPPLHRFYRHLVLLLEAKDRSRHTRQSSSGAVYARTSGGYTVLCSAKEPNAFNGDVLPDADIRYETGTLQITRSEIPLGSARTSRSLRLHHQDPRMTITSNSFEEESNRYGRSENKVAIPLSEGTFRPDTVAVFVFPPPRPPPLKHHNLPRSELKVDSNN